MNLVNILKSAAHGYGTERRVLLLHGPVGSSKSTIARLLKKGLERYSRTDEGRLYTFGWREEALDGERDLRRLPDARGAAPPDPARAPRRGRSRRSTPRPTAHGLRGDDRGGPLPVLPPDVQRADGAVRRRLGEGPRATSGSAA